MADGDAAPFVNLSARAGRWLARSDKAATTTLIG